jgi:hypothetical protein
VARDDSRLLVVARRVARQLEHLRRQILHHRRQVDGGAGSHSLRVVALAEEAMDSPDGELKPRAARPRLRLPLHLTAFASSRHDTIVDTWLMEEMKKKRSLGAYYLRDESATSVT